MKLSDVSVTRPVFASVLSLLLLAFGLVSYDRLSLREYPQIDPPVVSIDVTYPGAPANIVETRITQILEDRISGIEGIEYISSSSTDGRSRVTVVFTIDRDIDGAANDIRDRIAGVADNLPEGAEPAEVRKADSSSQVVIWQNLASAEMTVPELTDYAKRYLRDQYSTLDGVAAVLVGGGQQYALRIWLDRQALAARQLSVSDVESALRAENLELPAGRLESDDMMFRARVTRHFEKPSDFSELVIAEGDNGYLIRLGDVARVEMGLVEERNLFRGDGVPMVGIGVMKQSTANTLGVTQEVQALTKRINPTLPKGMHIHQSYDASVFIKASIDEVFSTLLIAVLCVVLVIYLFLGSLRAMIIPAVTVPVSLIATFIVMDSFGFSINVLTLLALVLAIGLVVDDAIVMLENIVRRMQNYGESALVASFRGSRQVGFAVIATTLVLIAVFVPITFLEGRIGRLFTEFAITISAAVAFSSLVALTLCPMLASKILGDQLADEDHQPNPITRLIDKLVNWARRGYMKWLLKLLKRPLLSILVFMLTVAATGWLLGKTPREFSPQEDRGTIYMYVNAPEGATYSFVKEYMEVIESRLLPYLDKGEVSRILIRTPRAWGTIENFNSGFVIIKLNDWSERRPAKEIQKELSDLFNDLPGVNIHLVMRNGLGGGTDRPLQFVLGGSSYEQLAEWRDTLIKKVSEDNPRILKLDSDYKETRPQIDLKVDYDRAGDLGVTVSEIGRTLQTMMGGRNVTTFLKDGEEYNVVIEGERDAINSFTDISNIYVRSVRSGELIPLSNLVEVEEYGSAQSLARYNRIRAITLTANLEEGYSLGEAIDYMNRMVREHLPPEVIVDYKGPSRNLMTSGDSVLFVFLLGLAVVFLVLAAQFESFVHPVVIMLTVPVALGGGLLGLLLTDGTLNIYSQIALIMLIGLAAKNGILIVEFANQLRDEGMGFNRALLTSSETRFRPILMTSLTTITGAIPLVLSFGAGAETRSVIGVVILSGVLASTVFTLFLVPMAYSLIARGTGSPGDVARRLEQQSDTLKTETGIRSEN